MGISIRGMAIGALTELKEKRVLAAEEERQKRLEDRKFKNQSRLQRQSDDEAYKRTKYASDASLLAAREKAEAKKTKETREALVAREDMYDQFGLPKVLGKQLPIDLRAKRSNTQGLFYLAQFDAAVGWGLKEINGMNVSENQKKQTLGRFDAWLGDNLKRVLVQTDAYKTSKTQTGEFDYNTMFHLQSGMPNSYNYMNSHPELQKKLDEQIRTFANLHKTPDHLATYLKENPNSLISRLTDKFTPLEQTILTNSLPGNGDLGTLEETGLIPALKANTPEALLLAAKKVDTIQAYRKKPFDSKDNINAIITAAAIGVSEGRTFMIQRGSGKQSKTVFKHAQRYKEIEKTRETHETNSKLLDQVGDVRKLNRSLQHGNKLAEKATFTLNAFRKLEFFAFSIKQGLGLSGNKMKVEISDEDRESMVDSFSSIEGLNGKSFVESLERNANDKLLQARESIFRNFNNMSEDEKSIAEERFYNEAKYEALKIQLVYRIAKMVQGGSGGQAVSNADFQAVLKSFQAGNWGTLQNEQAVFEQLQYMVEREFIYSKVMTNKAVLTNEHAVVDRALRLHKVQHEYLKQRKIAADNADELDTSTNNVDEQMNKAFNVTAEEKYGEKQSNKRGSP